MIVGYTPTALITGVEDEPFRIWQGKGIIEIDCGCGTPSAFGRLACLLLDDMQEFHVGYVRTSACAAVYAAARGIQKKPAHWQAQEMDEHDWFAWLQA